MKRISDPLSIGKKLVLKNRLARSGTHDAISYGGHLTPQVGKIYHDLAAGGVGMIITGQTEVSRSGGTADCAVRAYLPEYEAELRAIADDVHACGSALIVQLNHGGIKSRSQPNPLVGPSPCEPAPGVTVRELTEDEIAGIVDDFARAAVKSRAAGADGVQIHNAHGYLLATFYSPKTNRRTDRYGGSRENRARIIFEIYDAIRAAVPDPDFVVGIKTNLSDLIEPSISKEDSLWLCQELERRGLDFAEFSCGLMPGGPGPAAFLPMPEEPWQPIFYRATADMARQLTIPVFAVNGYRVPDDIERCLNESEIQGISLCRPLIREPDLPRRWLSGDRSPARCTSCGACEADTNWIQRCEKKPDVVPEIKWFGCPLEQRRPRTAALS